MLSGAANLMSKEAVEKKVYGNMGIPQRKPRPESGDIRMR
jgi:hypothetical protein